MAKVRTFVAVEIDPTVRRKAEQLIGTFRKAQADVKWVEFQNLHLTLKFLGDVRMEETAEVCAAVAWAAADVTPFELEIRGAGAFPNPGRPRTLWLGCQQGTAQLTDLQRRIEAGLEKLGFRPEARSFTPHLTIGRARSGGPGTEELGRLLQQHAEYEVGRSDVAEVTVFASQLGPQGPTYTPLSHAPLEGEE
jgi:2'-5' RNA ligase